MQVLTLSPELIQRSRDGDAAARQTLYEELSREVLRFLTGLRLGLRAPDLEDALQETFLRLFGSLDRFDGKRSLKAWALGIARNVALDLRWRKNKAGPGEVDDLPGDDTVETTVLADERRRTVAAALSALPAQPRALLVLRHVIGLTMQELADGLSCSLPTARARLREAGAQLKLELSRRGEGA